jgi:hypothetical protein
VVVRDVDGAEIPARRVRRRHCSYGNARTNPR